MCGLGCGCLILLILILAAVAVVVIWFLTHGWAFCNGPGDYGHGMYPWWECTRIQ